MYVRTYILYTNQSKFFLVKTEVIIFFKFLFKIINQKQKK